MRAARAGLALAALAAGAAATQATAASESCVHGLDGSRACFEAPTTRYGHGVLGPGAEWGTLSARFPDGATARVVLPPDAVFEDLVPRLVQIDGGGPPEIAVVESDAARGARLAVYARDGDALRLVAATPHIGSRNRWLAPIAIADLDGDGAVEAAYVETPHLNGVLKVWRFSPDGLTPVAELGGLSNHRIGQNFISGRVAPCDGRMVMVLPDFAWRRVLAVELADGALTAWDLGPLRNLGSIAAADPCAG